MTGNVSSLSSPLKPLPPDLYDNRPSEPTSIPACTSDALDLSAGASLFKERAPSLVY